MLSKERQMEVLEAFDLTKSFRAAAQLTGVDHHTVKRLVTGRALGTDPVGEPAVRSVVAEAFADKIVEWVDRSNGKVRADVVHDKLVQMGYRGSERTTRRVVAALKATWRHELSMFASTPLCTPAHLGTRSTLRTTYCGPDHLSGDRAHPSVLRERRPWHRMNSVTMPGVLES